MSEPAFSWPPGGPGNEVRASPSLAPGFLAQYGLFIAGLSHFSSLRRNRDGQKGRGKDWGRQDSQATLVATVAGLDF